MSVNKHIRVNDGSNREFQDNIVGEIVLDAKPEVGSFNLVTSDAVARAVAGASGEVPQVTESDNGKVLKAVYDEGGPAVEWGEAQGGDVVVVEYTSDSMSDEDVRAAAAQIKAALTDGKTVVLNDVVNRGLTSGLRNEALLVYTTVSNDCLTAVFATPPNDANALDPSSAHSCTWTMYVLTEAASGGTSTFAHQGASVAQVPTASDGKLYTEMTAADNGKVLRVTWDAFRQTAYAQWATPSVPTVDQTYDASSANAQSGVAVAEAVGSVLPSLTGNAGKVLAVNSGATGTEWVAAGGGDTIAPYTLRFKFLNTSFDPSASITGTHGTWTRVSSDPNIWDWTYESGSWQNCFRNKSFSPDGSALIGSGDLSGVTSMQGMFHAVSNLAYVKMGNFGATCDFTEMFNQAGVALHYVELGEPDDICYGSMKRMFASNSYNKNYPLQVIFNGVLAATDMSGFANSNDGLVEAPRIETNLFRHACSDFSYAFKDCSNLKVCPQYWLSTTSTNWYQAFSGCKSLVAAPNLNLEYATTTGEMFSGCESLAYVPDYNVSRATSIAGMFSGCRSLTKIPSLTGLDNKSSVDRLFEDCYGIQTGADTLYQQLSTQATPPTSTTDTFKNCGAATVTGSAALATIPSSWGGTGT